MRYLFVHTGREWSGTARAFAAAARGLAERGHQVMFVAEPECTVERVVSQLAAVPGRSPLFEVELLNFGSPWIMTAWRLRSLIRRYDANVIFVQGNREHLIAAVARRLGSRANVVRRVPAGRTLDMNTSGRVAAWLAPTCFVFTNEPDARSAVLPRRAAGQVLAPLGVRLPPHPNGAAAPAEEYIVCLHDASSRNRAATAIRTVAMLSEHHPRLRLVVMGEGAYDDDLRMQAAALRSLNLISFLGERDDALHVMRGARLGWVVSDSDTAAYGMLDLMSLGVPVIAGEHSVAERYVLSEITGILLPPNDAYQTAAVVADLLTADVERETMGHAARARVEREFPESAMIDGFERAAATAARGRP